MLTPDDVKQRLERAQQAFFDPLGHYKILKEGSVAKKLSEVTYQIHTTLQRQLYIVSINEVFQAFPEIQSVRIPMGKTMTDLARFYTDEAGDTPPDAALAKKVDKLLATYRNQMDRTADNVRLISDFFLDFRGSNVMVRESFAELVLPYAAGMKLDYDDYYEKLTHRRMMEMDAAVPQVERKAGGPRL